MDAIALATRSPLFIGRLSAIRTLAINQLLGHRSCLVAKCLATNHNSLFVFFSRSKTWEKLGLKTPGFWPYFTAFRY